MPTIRIPARPLPSLRRRRLTRAGFLIGSLSLACRSDVVGPGRVEGSYVLESVDGRAMPATAAEGGGQRYIVLADTLGFSASGMLVRSLAYRHLSATFAPADTI
jgi:hypothetical protein